MNKRFRSNSEAALQQPIATRGTRSSSSNFATPCAACRQHGDLELISQQSLAGIAQLLLLPTVMHCLRFSTPAQVYAQKADKHQPAVTRVLPTCQAHRFMLARPHSTVRPSVLRARDTAIAHATMQEISAPTVQQTSGRTLLCTSVTASTFEQALDEIRQISEAGVDLIELRLDMLTDFDAEKHLQQLLSETDTPKLVTMRPTWEGYSQPPCWTHVCMQLSCIVAPIQVTNFQSQVHSYMCKALMMMMTAGAAVISCVARKQISGQHCRGNYDGPEPQRLAVLKYAAHLGASHVDVELKVATYFFAGDCSNLSAKGHSASNLSLIHI